MGILSGKILCEQEVGCKLSMSGIQYKIRNRLERKFEKVGATSEKNAVTAVEAKLDYQEECWLHYFAGSFLGRIKKTKDHRYYI